MTTRAAMMQTCRHFPWPEPADPGPSSWPEGARVLAMITRACSRPAGATPGALADRLQAGEFFFDDPTPRIGEMGNIRVFPDSSGHYGH